MRDLRVVRLLGLAAAIAIVACNESLDTGAACPTLCPPQNVVVRDTLLNAAVSVDTAIPGYPLVGTEPSLLLAARGDTVDVRGIIRFDTLTSTYTKSGGDSAIVQVDSSYLQLRIDKTTAVATAPVRFDLYNVDTTAEDTSLAAVRAMFRDDRLVGGTTLDTSAIKDTTLIPLDNAKLLDLITHGRRLRLGIRVSSANAVSLLAGTVDASRSAFLLYDPDPDTTIKAVQVAPQSKTPTNNAQLLNDLVDYQVVMKEPATPITTDVLTIGGLSGRRAYFRFDVPSNIIDSSTVLRATLEVVQKPLRGIDKAKTLTMYPVLVTAGSEITDLARSTFLVGAAGGFDSLQMTPADSGTREIEIVAALRTWGQYAKIPLQRAIVLRSALEGTSAMELQFYSTRAPVDLRPRLRVSYATKTNFGIP